MLRVYSHTHKKKTVTVKDAKGDCLPFANVVHWSISRPQIPECSDIIVHVLYTFDRVMINHHNWI